MCCDLAHQNQKTEDRLLNFQVLNKYPFLLCRDEIIYVVKKAICLVTHIIS